MLIPGLLFPYTRLLREWNMSTHQCIVEQNLSQAELLQVGLPKMRRKFLFEASQKSVSQASSFDVHATRFFLIIRFSVPWHVFYRDPV